MKSIKELYCIGNGPSSSHTMGPKKAASLFAEKHPIAKKFVVTLYGSLAATGKGHLTDEAILSVLEPLAPTTIEWLDRKSTRLNSSHVRISYAVFCLKKKKKKKNLNLYQ